jgi:hypothetical protein
MLLNKRPSSQAQVLLSKGWDLSGKKLINSFILVIMFGPKFQVKGNTPGTGRSQNKNAPQLRLSCASVYFMGTRPSAPP